MTPKQIESRDRFRTRILPVVILLIISLLAYSNAWPNNLTWDDAVFGIGNRLSGISWADFERFFTQDVWASIGHDSGLYRPLLLASVSLDIEIFGNWVAGLHLVNILLHALTTVAVYGLTRYLLTALDTPFSRASYIALLAALVFAVHPIHTEVVNSIFNRSEMLATLGVAGGLWWFLPAVEKTPWRAWGILGIIYLFVMMSRETGIVLPGLVVLCLWFTLPGSWQQRLRGCLPVFWLLIPMAFYLVIRAHALDTPMSLQEMGTAVPGATTEVATEVAPGAAPGAVPGAAPHVAPHGAPGAARGVAQGAAPGKLSIPVLGMYLDTGHVMPAVQVWFDAFKLMLWPDPLLNFHDKPDANPWLATGIQLAFFVFALYLALKRRPGLFIGLMFFYLAVLPASRIIGEGVGPHLAERYIYMPSVGATIMLAFGLCWIAEKFSLKQTVLFVTTAVILLTPVTLVRNSQWATTAMLAEADYEKGASSDRLLQTYISALLMNDQLYKAAKLCDENESTVKTRWFVASYCGQVFASMKAYEKAETAFRYSLKNRKGRSSSHYALAVMYLSMNRRDDARENFDLAAETEQQAFLQAYLKAEGLMRLYPSDRARLLEARSYMTKSIELHPQYFHARKRLEDLDEILASLEPKGN